MIRRNVRCVAALFAALMLFVFVGCEKAPTPDVPMDASAVSFDASIYYARDGRIRFLYDSTCDMISAPDGYDVVSLYSGGTYSLVISYTSGTLSRKDADALIKSEFQSAGGSFSLSKKTKSVTVSGHAFRYADLSAVDGSVGAVLYGSTLTGFAEIYYILSADATEEDHAHIKEILNTVALGEFEADYEEEDKIFVE